MQEGLLVGLFVCVRQEDECYVSKINVLFGLSAGIIMVVLLCCLQTNLLLLQPLLCFMSNSNRLTAMGNNKLLVGNSSSLPGSAHLPAQLDARSSHKEEDSSASNSNENHVQCPHVGGDCRRRRQRDVRLLYPEYTLTRANQSDGFAPFVRLVASLRYLDRWNGGERATAQIDAHPHARTGTEQVRHVASSFLLVVHM